MPKKLKRINPEAFLGAFEEDQGESKGDLEPWSPSLSGSQQELFESTSKYVLAYGERASGKTFVLGGHKLVRHAYENFNALCLVVVGVKSQATQGGVWHKLQTEILPEWKEGLGIEHTDERMDLQKAPYIDIQNRYGGWSRISLMSAPFGNILSDRIKGYEPSYVFVDELTNLDGPAYFNAIVQQIGRRQGIEGCQQYCAACNPSGPSHWVYKRFFESPLDEDGNYNKDYHVVHVKIAENVANLPEGYYDRVMEAVSNDHVEAQRMLEGKWVDRPAGDSILAPYYNKNLHVVGDKKKGIVPNPDFPVIIGYDPGSVNNACIFMQNLVGSEKSIWTVFDELVTINKKIPYTTLIPLIYRKMKYWNDHVDKKLKYVHISDNSAFNQYRAKTGSYDVRDFEEISKAKCDVFGCEPIRMKAAPKFAGSVEGRVRLMIAKLTSTEIMFSAQCTQSIMSIRHIASEKQRDGKYDPNLGLKPKRSVYIHAFDAMTYPIMYFDVKSPTASATVSTSSIIEINA